MRIKKNVSLAPLSTFKIGGRAEYFYLAKNSDYLIEAIKWAKNRKLPWRIFSGGSNIVFPDGKLKGLLIKIDGVKLEFRGSKILADPGAALAELIQKSIAHSLKGLETLFGIPGTLGGAIVGNAGAYGHSISEVVEKVEVLNRKSIKQWLKNKECQFAYRESIFKHKPLIILRTVLRFKKGNSKILKKVSRDIIKLRLKKYKPGLRCPGSFFKNVLVKEVSQISLKKVDKSKIIEGKIPAGYLLEEVGAKGMKIGGIQIADFHGNLFINRGGAKAADVKKMARILKGKVRRKFGIELEEEIRYF